MSKLYNMLNQLENHIPNIEKTNSKISNSTIGWQIDHCLMVINGVVGQLAKSNPVDFKPKWGFYKWLIFTTGSIPRGKVRAPKVVTPVEMASVDDLKSKLEFTKNNLKQLNELQSTSFFNHPIFGNLNVKQSEKFLAIHTQHHLKIIRDILK